MVLLLHTKKHQELSLKTAKLVLKVDDDNDQLLDFFFFFKYRQTSKIICEEFVFDIVDRCMFTRPIKCIPMSAPISICRVFKLPGWTRNQR